MTATPGTGPRPGRPTDGRPARKRGRPAWRRWLLRALAVAGGLFLVLVVVVLVAYARTTIPDPKQFAVQQATTFAYSDGTTIGRLGANRESVPLSKVPDAVQKAVLAAEDRGFYSEPGISPSGILRAAWADLRGGDISQGASTITQQYVKNAYLSDERTFSRKFTEILISVKLSRSVSKDRVLEDYLNTVYFGRGAYGIQTAARAYYGKDVAQLTPAEGALLAVQLRGPALYDPVGHPERAKARFDYVIAGMKQQGWLPAGASTDFPQVIPYKGSRASGLAGPDGYLIRQAEAELAAKGFDENPLVQQGVTVTLTIDRNAQQAAVDAVNSVLETSPPSGLLTPLVSVVPGDGAIRAEYAGADYNADQFNAVTQGRAQAGSTFKAYTLAAALKQGISLRSMWDGNSPVTVPGYGNNNEVHNFGPGAGEQFGQIDLLEATAESVNTVYVPLGIKAGINNVAETAIDLGIRSSDVDAGSLRASISLGTASVFPIDQVQAYAALAARGSRAKPYIVATVTTRAGKQLLKTTPQPENVLDQKVADQVTYALEGVVDHGTAAGAQLTGRPAAGKTGTTSDSTAAWFNGYTPQLATVVGFFYRDSAKPITGVAGVAKGQEITGASGPAKIWQAYMNAALDGQKVMAFPTVELSAPSPTAAPVPTSSSPSPTDTSSPTATASPVPTDTGSTGPSSSSSTSARPTAPESTGPTSAAPSRAPSSGQPTARPPTGSTSPRPAKSTIRTGSPSPAATTSG